MSKYFCELLISNKLILPEDREVYEYGFKEFQIIVFFTIIFLSISFVKNYLLDALIFLFSFIVLRAYYPGIHSKSKVICCIWSNGIYYICYDIMLNSHMQKNMDICFILLPGIILLYLNFRKLKMKKSNVKKIKTGILILILIVIACVLAYKNGISIIFMNTYLALILATILHILNYWKGENGYETN